MKNKESILKCGPYFLDISNDVAARELQCIQDYKEQGYIRIPNPK